MPFTRFYSAMSIYLSLSFATHVLGADCDPPYVASSGAGLIEVHRPTDMAGSDVDAVWQRNIRTHAALLRQRELFSRVAYNEASELRKTAVFKKLGDAPQLIEWMEKNVRVQVVPGTSLSEIAVTPMESGRDATTVVREIVQQYLLSVWEKQWDRGQRRAQILLALRTKYKAEYQEAAAQTLHVQTQKPDPGEKPASSEGTESANRKQSHLLDKLEKIQDELDELEARNFNRSEGDVTWAVPPSVLPDRPAKP